LSPRLKPSPFPVFFDVTVMYGAAVIAFDQSTVVTVVIDNTVDS